MNEYAKLSMHHRENNTAETLAAVRDYLNANGCYMPLQKYPFDRDNIKTWRFIENPRKPTTMLNPEFQFKEPKLRY